MPEPRLHTVTAIIASDSCHSLQAISDLEGGLAPHERLPVSDAKASIQVGLTSPRKLDLVVVGRPAVLGLSPVSDGRRFSFGRSLSSPLFFFDGSVSSSIGAVEFGLRRKVGLFGSSLVLSGRR